MSEKLKINCGGFYLDNETITEENGMLKVIGGGSGGGALIVHETGNTQESPSFYTLDHTAGEIIAAMPLVYIEQYMGQDESYMRGFTQFSSVNGTVTYVYMEGTGYVFSYPESEDGYIAATLNDYPVRNADK